MYKSCKKCNKLTVHDNKMNNRTGKKIFTCKTCKTESTGLSSIQRAELDEKRAQMYKEKTFDDLLNHARQEMQNNDPKRSD